MKTSKLLQAILILSNLMVVASCNNNTPTPTPTPTPSTPTESTPVVESTPDEKPQVKFEDKVVEYDGTVHELKVEELPEGATVKYEDNENVEPGEYVVTATVIYADKTREELTAKLTIEKLESVITAEAIQAAIHSGEGALPTYSLNNDEQKISVQKIFTPGKHEVILYGCESAHYKESNRIKVSFDVKIGNSLGIVFDSQTFEVDGTEKKLEAQNVPAGYHVEYENNTATTQGKYNAVCKVYNENNELKLTLNALLTMDNKENAEFAEYLKEFFVDHLDGDYLSMNILLENPENFGFVRDVTDEAKWYTYESYEDNYKEEGYAEMNTYYDMLKAFKEADLSYHQQISYKVLDDFFISNLEYYAPESKYEPLANLVYIDQFGGYAAEFGTYMEAYQLRREQDIKDVVSYIKSLPEAFESYITYANDRIEAGFPLSDYTLDEMIGFLEDVIADGEDYYLTDILVSKVNAVDYLDETAKANYVNEIETAMKDYFLVAFEALADALPALQGKCTTEGYWASYGEVGKFMYEKELKDLLGMPNLDMEAYGAYLKEKVEFYAGKIDSVVNKIYKYTGPTYNRIMGFLQNGNSVVGIQDPNKMID